MLLTRDNAGRLKSSAAASPTPMAQSSSKRVAVLFHVADFNDGGIESSLMQWLRIFDRARFAVTLSVMFSSPAFEQRFRAQIPADVGVEILTDKPWLNVFQARRYAHRLSKLGRIGRDVFNTLVVRPYVKTRVAELAQRHEIIVDFDMSLRRLAGRFGVATDLADGAPSASVAPASAIETSFAASLVNMTLLHLSLARAPCGARCPPRFPWDV